MEGGHPEPGERGPIVSFSAGYHFFQGTFSNVKRIVNGEFAGL